MPYFRRFLRHGCHASFRFTLSSVFIDAAITRYANGTTARYAFDYFAAASHTPLLPLLLLFRFSFITLILLRYYFIS